MASIFPKTPALVWMTSTKVASLGSSFHSSLSVAKKGRAGSKPIYTRKYYMYKNSTYFNKCNLYTQQCCNKTTIMDFWIFIMQIVFIHEIKISPTYRLADTKLKWISITHSFSSYCLNVYEFYSYNLLLWPCGPNWRLSSTWMSIHTNKI